MKSRILILLVVAFGSLYATQSRAESDTMVFQCGVTSEIFNPGKIVNFTVTKGTSGLHVNIDGEKSAEKVTSTSASLDGLADFLKCKFDDDKCRDSASRSKPSGFADFANLIALAKQANSDKTMSGANVDKTLAQLNPRQIKSGKSYVFGNTTKFGNLGVYEFYDQSDKLLGRYVYSVELMKCRDEAASSTSKGSTPANAAKRIQ